MARKASNEVNENSMQDIQKVVHRCQNGHLDAFNTLFIQFQHRVYDLACIILRDDIIAEDVVQDTFLVVFQKIDGFRGASSFETWLTTITVNQCRMHQRKQKARQFLSLEQLSPRRLLYLSKRQQDVADTVHNRQRSQTLWDMVNQLPERLRLPIILRYRFAFSCADIGVILKRRTSTIYQHLSEGRRELERMQPQERGHLATLMD